MITAIFSPKTPQNRDFDAENAVYGVAWSPAMKLAIAIIINALVIPALPWKLGFPRGYRGWVH